MKKLYSTPNIEIINFQGDIVLNTTSETVNHVCDSEGGGYEISISSGNMSEAGQEEAYSGGQSQVWDD
ncbi:hypothetical protein [uncultured Prevotella sp.]|uniref:hypothetical protein n=1 Tax=uncultured Prevotella sp. TaxID=159272 RepID=UPI0027E31694|nr:hypothetical protein [uncultured Prevotella sp.]